MKIGLFLIPVVIATALFLSTKLGTGDIIPPSVSIDVQERIAYHASQWGLEIALVKAIAKVESNFNPLARNYERSAEDFDDSFGLMQISPMLAEDYGLIKDYRNISGFEIEMIFEINNNLSVACWQLKNLSKYPFSQMVQSYNVGEWGYKTGIRNKNYLEKVRGYYYEYSS